MGFVRTTFCLLSLIAILTGCNTTDALTPQVDVGGGRFPQSNPVTDRDLQQMAQSQQPVYPVQQAQPSGGRISGQPLAPMQQQQQTYRQSDGATRDGTGRDGPGAPPRSLEQQAASLGQPRTTYASPSRAAPSAETEEQAQPVRPERQPEPQEAAVSKGSGQAIRFLPIIGAPLPAVTPLSRQLGAEARARGLSIKGNGDTSARHVLKGYFSAVSGGGTVTVTYVWDVLDGNGARLNRIQGQESFAGEAKDPWSAVPPSVMQNIATKTMDSYTRWAEGP